MLFAANEHGQIGTPTPRAAVDRACALLERALTTTGEDIRAIAAQFESLARDVQQVLNLTTEIVECVQQDWVQSIVPVAQALASSARRFIEERIDSLAAISNVFTGEATMLENLLSLTTEQRSIAREGKTLGVLASIEVARLAEAGSRFEYMARELDEFSAMVSLGAAEVRTEAEQRRKTLIDRRRKLDLTLQRRTSHFKVIETELGDAIDAMNSALSNFARIPADFQTCVSLIAANIARIVEAVQVQDVTRQQTEHVRDLLKQVSGEIESSSTPEDDSAHQNAILKVQAFQVQSACANTQAWVDEVNHCLEGILRIGSSDVLAIGKSIIEQELALSSQLARIEQLEQECAADDAEIEASLAGISELTRITKTHLTRSRQARDRMQLLNFNSMIEARLLGKQASAVLEITRNIGRISTAWSALTDRSGDTLEDLLTSSSSAEETHRLKTHQSIQNLGNARDESNAGLAALSRGAAIAHSNGDRVHAAVSAIHDRSATLGRVAGHLANSIALMQEAQDEIQNASRQLEPYAVALTHEDRQRIENECAAIYSCELERLILSAALNGDEMPVSGAALVGNDVELF